MNILEDYIQKTSALLKCNITAAATPQFSDRELTIVELRDTVDTAGNRALVGLANVQQVYFQGYAKFKPCIYIDTKMAPINNLPKFGQKHTVEIITNQYQINI